MNLYLLFRVKFKGNQYQFQWEVELAEEKLRNRWIPIVERIDGENEVWMWDSASVLHTISVSILKNKYKCQMKSFYVDVIWGSKIADIVLISSNWRGYMYIEMIKGVQQPWNISDICNLYRRNSLNIRWSCGYIWYLQFFQTLYFAPMLEIDQVLATTLQPQDMV